MRDEVTRRSHRRLRRIAMLAVGVSGCALLQSTPADVPPPSPNARTLWTMPPAHREAALPVPRVFAARDWLDRLVCSTAEQPSWRRTSASGPIERYDVDCRGTDTRAVQLDLSQPEPDAPPGLRLLSEEGYTLYRAALQAGERKDWTGALRQIKAALEAAPGEPVYRIARLSLLYATGRIAEAMVEADELLETQPSPVTWKFRALAARDMGLRNELFASLDGLLASTTPKHPMYGEAICARGMLLSDAGERRAQATHDLERGCELRQDSCCQRLEEKRAAERAARLSIQAARALRVKLPEVLPPLDAPAGPEAPLPADGSVAGASE